MQTDEILLKVYQNTEVIKRNTEKVEKENIELKATINEGEEKRKEQLREAQKKFKKIGFSCKETTYEEFEKLAQSLNMTTTMMVRQFMMLLLESEKFQSHFKEFISDGYEVEEEA